MGRNRVDLTPTQQDPTLFGTFRDKIRAIGGRTLANFGLISHETIYRYCRGLAVDTETETLIIRSVELYYEEKQKLAEPSKQNVRRILELS